MLVRLILVATAAEVLGKSSKRRESLLSGLNTATCTAEYQAPRFPETNRCGTSSLNTGGLPDQLILKSANTNARAAPTISKLHKLDLIEAGTSLIKWSRKCVSSGTCIYPLSLSKCTCNVSACVRNPAIVGQYRNCCANRLCKRFFTMRHT